MKILVVDDAIVARKMINRHLMGSPYESAAIIEATSGENGLDLFDQQIDVVLSDWNMPGINGIEFVQSIRQLETQWENRPRPRTPIVMITTEGTVQKMNLAKDAGVDEYIVKPFSAKQLIEVLNKVLES